MFCTRQRKVDATVVDGVLRDLLKMPLYRLINDPSRALRERGHVKAKASPADSLSGDAAAA